MLAETFPMRRRSVHERLSHGRALIGLLQLRPNPLLMQMAAKVGYDFLFLDDEHGEFSDADYLEAISVLAKTDVIAMVRLAGHDPDALCRYIGMGADVIIVPHVSTAEEARRLVRAMSDATGLSPHSGSADAASHRERPYLIAIIESALGVSHAEAILAVDGIDGVLVGPSDLSADLGCRGDYSNAAYANALAHVEQAAIAAGKILGTAPHAAYTLEKLLLRGHRVFVMGSDASLIEEAMRAKVSLAQSALERAPARQGAQSNERVGEVEPIIEPELPIVDAHHHLWFVPEEKWKAMEGEANVTTRGLAAIFRRYPRYLFDEFMADLRSGHNVRATVFVGAHTMHRVNGPESMKAVGEIEFVNGVAAMAASGLFGEARTCAGIVGSVDLTVGDAVQEILRAHLQAGGTRYRGVRGARVTYDDDDTIIAAGAPNQLLQPQFRAGFRWLQPLGLSFDVLVLEPQLADLIDLARAFPETQIILNHVGGPVGVGRYVGLRDQRFPIWREHMRVLATCANVTVKLGGLGNPLGGFDSFMARPPAISAQLANEWRPYIETCIETFGVNRCMFESNFPVDSSTCSYRVLWNAFKRLTAGASHAEKTALFSGTATRVYRLLPVDD